MFKIEGTHVDVARKEYTPLIKVGWCVSCCRCNYLSIVLLEKKKKQFSQLHLNQQLFTFANLQN